MANCQNAAKVLDELMLELMEKGITIPRQAVDDLKSGRSFANIGIRQPNDSDIEAKAMFALQNVEMNLLSLAETGISAEYAEKWQGRILKAYSEETTQVSAASAFVSGVPKGKHWIRIQASELSEVHGFQKLLDANMLSSVAQEDGYLLIYGKKEGVTAFLKEIRKMIGKMEKCKK